MESGMEDRLVGSSEEDTKDLSKRVWVESKKFLRVSIPAVIARITSFGLIVVTQLFIGHIGETELASYALVQFILVQFVNGLILGMSNALETLCGQAFGAKQYHMLGIYMQRSWIIVAITATIVLPLFIFATPLFRLLGEEENLSIVAGQIALWFIPVLYNFVFSLTLQMFLQSQLKNAIVGWLASISFVIHVILSYLFVIKLKLGIPGAMGSLAISMWSSTIGQFIFVVGGWCPDTWKGFSTSAFSELFPVVKLSASSGVMLCLELWYNAVLVLLAGYQKNAEISISAFSICINLLSWVLMIFLGFLTAACVRVANELGRGNANAVRFSIKVIMGQSLTLGLIFFTLALVFGHDISYLFSSSTELAETVSSLSFLLALSVLLNSIQPVLTGVAIGAGWQTMVAYVNLACYYLVGIPIGALLAYLAHLEVRGIWIGMICGVALQTLVLSWMTWRANWDSQVDKTSTRLNRWLLPPSQESEENALHH